MPYIHDTEATTIISSLPESKEEVALNLNFSICSLIDKSFSIYRPEEGMYASG